MLIKNESQWGLIRNEKPVVLFEKLPYSCEVRGHSMCREMPVIPVKGR
jgi:hypothetical protein